MEEIKKGEIKTVSEAMQITQIAIDNYDDLFSDFDPSPYEKRIISEDFLQELHHRYSENKRGEFSINITVPRAVRSEKTESLVKKRFKEYFKKELKHLQKIKKEKTNGGLLRLFIGGGLVIFLVFIPALDIEPFLTIFSVLIWYTLWSGFEHIFESTKHIQHKMSFFEKFVRAEYNFVSEEDVLQIIQQLQEPVKAEQKSQGSS
jgi:hypothetical protein